MRRLGAAALLLGAALWLLTAAGLASGTAAAVSRHELALMPLPGAALGARVAALPLAQDSGVVTNGDAANDANETVSAATFTHLGRITGYTLDYGSSGPTGRGVFEAQTTVELYRSPAAASSGLAFWRKDDATPGLPPGSGVSTSVGRCTAIGVGEAGFCETEKVRLHGTLPLYGVEVGFATGSLVGQVSISATSPGLARSLAAAAAPALARRIGAVLGGQVGGRPVPLPARVKPGPPPHGPSLAAMALTPADLGSGTVADQGYQTDPNLQPLSEYVRDMAPAGTLATLSEEVLLFRSPTQASYEFALLSGALDSPQGWRAYGTQGTGVQSFLDQHSIVIAAGDQAHGLLGTAVLGGSARFSLGFLFLRIGSAVEFITFGSPIGGHLEPVAMTQLAHLAAAQAERGLHTALATA